MDVQESELDARLRALREAPTPSLPRSASDIRRTGHRRQQRNRIVTTLGCVAAVAALVVFVPWRSAPSPAPPAGASATPSTSATPTAAAADLKPIWNPWTDKAYYPGFINSVNAAGMEGTVGIQPAQFNVPSGTDTFVLVPLSQQDPTAYTLAPDAKLYVSATWSNLPRPTDHTDFAPVTYSQFVTYARAQGASAKPDSVEVWYALNSKRQITLLFQVYHA